MAYVYVMHVIHNVNCVSRFVNRLEPKVVTCCITACVPTRFVICYSAMVRSRQHDKRRVARSKLANGLGVAGTPTCWRAIPLHRVFVF